MEIGSESFSNMPGFTESMEDCTENLSQMDSKVRLAMSLTHRFANPLKCTFDCTGLGEGYSFWIH